MNYLDGKKAEVLVDTECMYAHTAIKKGDAVIIVDGPLFYAMQLSVYALNESGDAVIIELKNIQVIMGGLKEETTEVRQEDKEVYWSRHFTQRITNVFGREGIKTLNDLKSKTEKELILMKNIGYQGIGDIKDFLVKIGHYKDSMFGPSGIRRKIEE